MRYLHVVRRPAGQPRRSWLWHLCQGTKILWTENSPHLRDISQGCGLVDTVTLIPWGPTTCCHAYQSWKGKARTEPYQAKHTTCFFFANTQKSQWKKMKWKKKIKYSNMKWKKTEKANEPWCTASARHWASAPPPRMSKSSGSTAAWHSFRRK